MTPYSPPSPAGGSVPDPPIRAGDADGGETRTSPPSALVTELPMTLDEAIDHIGARVQYTSATGALVTTGTISGVGAESVFVRYGQGLFSGGPGGYRPTPAILYTTTTRFEREAQKWRATSFTLLDILAERHGLKTEGEQGAAISNVAMLVSPSFSNTEKVVNAPPQRNSRPCFVATIGRPSASWANEMEEDVFGREMRSRDV